MDALVTVRVGSTRLPRKCLLSFGGPTVLNHVIKRALHFGIDPIVCTTTLAEDNEIIEIAKANRCRWFRGESEDKLKRWIGACNMFNITAFHTIDADDPFFDGNLCKASYEILVEKGYDIVYPSLNPLIGIMGYTTRLDVIAAAYEYACSGDTESFWALVEKIPGIKRFHYALKTELNHPVRLTLDYAEDYWMLVTVLRLVGPEAEWKDLERLFKENPDLHKINWFRNADYENVLEKKRAGLG